MTTTDYIISAALILLVIPQIRGTRMTLLHTLLPLAAVAAAAAYYLKSFPTEGHDVRLDAVTVAAGAALGTRASMPFLEEIEQLDPARVTVVAEDVDGR
ncbi:hypothetical protein AB0M86_32905, partial [Streptomyces sp. NPDC051639]